MRRLSVLSIAVRGIALASGSRQSSAAALAVASEGPAWRALQERLRAPVVADEWARHGEALTETLTGKATPADELDAPTAARVYHLYLPLYFFCRERLLAHRAAGGKGAVAIGISAPQGCGKTTLVNALVERFAADGLVCADVSFDDFYKTGADQDAVAAASPANPMLQVRGNAGTHDLPLGEATLEALTRGGAANDSAPVRIPRYDKAARGGRGDRAPVHTWPAVERPPDVVLLEGWMAGFSPLPAGAAALARHAGLPEVNELLGEYARWHDRMDAWITLSVAEPRVVYSWRLQAERAMAQAGRPGMSDEQVADFVGRYMPAYDAYLPALYAAASGGGVDGKPTFAMWVDDSRAPVSAPSERE